MKIRKFIAPSVPLALRQVHDDLGDRAVILNTRTLPEGGNPGGRVEVTAALDEEVSAYAGASATVAERAPRGARNTRPDLLGRVYGRSLPGPGNAAGSPPEPERKPRWRQTPDRNDTTAGSARPQVEERHIRSAADWLASLPAVQRHSSGSGHQARPPHENPEPTVPAPVKTRAASVEGPGDSAVVGQLRQLEEVVHRMASQTSGFALPLELSRLGERLRRTGLSQDHVHRCLQVIMRQLKNEEFDDREIVAKAAVDCLAQMLPESSEIRVGRKRRIVALVGPSGSGKTTAAARIAAGFVRRRRQRGALSDGGDIVLITADTKRVGALAQARAFADLIRVPLETAYDEQELVQAVANHEEARLVLVDLGGCGPHERSEMEEQKRMLAAIGVDEIHIVVDGLTGLDHIIEVARSGKEHGSQRTCLMVTKMDQSVRPGTIVSAAIDAELPISYITTSAAVPGGIRPGDLTPWIEWMVGLAPRPFTDTNA